ncbi:MAG TPA: hypothetical protein VMK42_20315 [Anaeromyxobacteraceae bacterium]|nr:hypothetical protein [Anaeromyxobacteraceae bacterium]
MRESTKESPADKGQVQMTGQCQICGAVGYTIALPGAAEPNVFCARCAIEYGEAIGEALTEDDIGE